MGQTDLRDDVRRPDNVLAVLQFRRQVRHRKPVPLDVIARLAPDYKDYHLTPGLEVPRPLLVAEGDSWFNYPVGIDIIAWLQGGYGYPVMNLAHFGDTLEDMAFGTRTDSNHEWLGSRLPLLQEAVESSHPAAVLLSAGGNDVAGDEFAAYLNHKDADLEVFRRAYLRMMLDGPFEKGYRKLIDAVHKVARDVPILIHGYGPAIPNGVGVFDPLNAISDLGPWLKPALGQKHIGIDEGTAIVRELIDELNRLLKRVADSYNPDPEQPTRVIAIDVQTQIGPKDWVNELHLTNAAYLKVACAFHEAILKLPKRSGVPHAQSSTVWSMSE